MSFKAGVALSDLVMTRSGDDLVIAISGTSDQLTIKNQFSATTSFWNPDRIDQFVFADGTVLTGAEVDVRVLNAQATAGNDTLRGYDSQDTLDGKAGNDLLSGYREADTFVFGSVRARTRSTMTATSPASARTASSTPSASNPTSSRRTSRSRAWATTSSSRSPARPTS